MDRQGLICQTTTFFPFRRVRRSLGSGVASSAQSTNQYDALRSRLHGFFWDKLLTAVVCLPSNRPQPARLPPDGEMVGEAG